MPETSREQQLQEILVAYLEAVESDKSASTADWLERYPEFAEELKEYIAGRRHLEKLAAVDAPTVAPDAPAREAASLTGASDSIGVAVGAKLRYFGDYELLEEIARGGMGVVYKARQVKLKRIVAVKMILAGELANQTDVERFHTEARAAANLHHPNIVAIHEIGQHDGHHYFSMDYVAGESLAQRIARGPLAAREAATLLKKVAQAVAFAHLEGVIHRDLKPANILLDANGEPHVTDFGLAKRVQGEPGAPATGVDLTHTGQVLGTPSYMPPEQAGGKSKEIGPRSDVYSLGAVLYCALTGRPPFQAASTLDTLLQVLDREPVSPRSLNAAVPRDLETICLKCLEKDPRRRYTSAKELVDELGRFLEGKPILARPVGRAERAWRWCRRNPVVAGLTVALALALVAGIVVSTTFAIQAEEEAKLSAGLAKKAKTEADRATAQERLTRRHLFSAHMNLANEAWKNGNALRVIELLNQHRPQGKEDDLRSFDWRYLWQQCHLEQKTIPLSQGKHVNEFLISPDGRYVAVCINLGDSNRFGELQLWDLTSGKLRKTIKGEIDPARPAHGPDKQFERFVFSPDSKLFAMVTWDFPIIWRGDAQSKSGWRERRAAQLTIWDLDTMKPRTTIPLPDQESLTAGFSFHHFIAVSSKKVAAGYWERGKTYSTVKIWDLPENDKVPVGPAKTLPHREWKGGGHSGFNHFTMTPDGKTLAWANRFDADLILTDLSGTSKDISLPIRAYELAFSPDGKTIAGWSSRVFPFPLTLFDAQSGKALQTLPPTMLTPVPIRFSPDGKVLAIATKFAVELWDVETKKQISDIRGHTDAIRGFGFGTDGKTLITVSRNRFAASLESFEAKLWNVNTRPGPDGFSVADKAPKAHLFTGQTIAPDSKTLAILWSAPNSSSALSLYDITAGTLGKELVQLKWDWADKAAKPKHFKPVRVNFSRDSSWLAVSGEGTYQDMTRAHHIQLWQIARGPGEVKAKLERTFFAPQSDAGRASLAAFSADSRKFVFPYCGRWSFDKKTGTTSYGSMDHFQIYDTTSGEDKQLAAKPKSQAPQFRGGPVTKVENISQAIFSSDGKRLFAAGMVVWESGQPREWIGQGSADCVAVWDTDSGNALSLLEAPGLGYYASPALVLSPDENTLATCHADHSIQILDVSEPKLREALAEINRKQPTEPAARPRAILRGHADHITAVAFHPDGKILASASMDRTIKLWDVVTGEVRLTLEGHAAPISSIAFTPDGNTMVSTDTGRTVKVWRAATRE